MFLFWGVREAFPCVVMTQLPSTLLDYTSFPSAPSAESMAASLLGQSTELEKGDDSCFPLKFLISVRR